MCDTKNARQRCSPLWPLRQTSYPSHQSAEHGAPKQRACVAGCRMAGKEIQANVDRKRRPSGDNSARSPPPLLSHQQSLRPTNRKRGGRTISSCAVEDADCAQVHCLLLLLAVWISSACCPTREPGLLLSSPCLRLGVSAVPRWCPAAAQGKSEKWGRWSTLLRALTALQRRDRPMVDPKARAHLASEDCSTMARI